MKYGVLKSKNDVFIVLNDEIVRKEISNIEDIKHSRFKNNRIIFDILIDDDTSSKIDKYEIVIKNKEDQTLLSNFDCYISIIDKDGEAVKILELVKS